MRVENDDFVIITANDVECLTLDTSYSAYPSLMLHESEVMGSIILRYLFEADSTGQTEESGIFFAFNIVYFIVDDTRIEYVYMEFEVSWIVIDDFFEDTEILGGTGPSLMYFACVADGGEREDTIALFTEVTYDLVLVFLCLF